MCESVLEPGQYDSIGGLLGFAVVCENGGGGWIGENGGCAIAQEPSSMGKFFPLPKKNKKSCLGVDFPTSISQGVGGRVEREG